VRPGGEQEASSQLIHNSARAGDGLLVGARRSPECSVKTLGGRPFQSPTHGTGPESAGRRLRREDLPVLDVFENFGEDLL
jgi:hypothetical protein